MLWIQHFSLKNIIVGNEYKKNKWWYKKEQRMNEEIIFKCDRKNDKESIKKCIWKNR